MDVAEGVVTLEKIDEVNKIIDQTEVDLKNRMMFIESKYASEAKLRARELEERKRREISIL